LAERIICVRAAHADCAPEPRTQIVRPSRARRLCARAAHADCAPEPRTQIVRPSRARKLCARAAHAAQRSKRSSSGGQDPPALSRLLRGAARAARTKYPAYSAALRAARTYPRLLRGAARAARTKYPAYSAALRARLGRNTPLTPRGAARAARRPNPPAVPSRRVDPRRAGSLRPLSAVSASGPTHRTTRPGTCRPGRQQARPLPLPPCARNYPQRPHP
jgi:hypothetical protein